MKYFVFAIITIMAPFVFVIWTVLIGKFAIWVYYNLLSQYK